MKEFIKEASSSSIFIRLFYKICFKYSFIKLSVYKVYEESQFFRLIRILAEITKATIKSSFLGRINELKGIDILVILNNSKFVKMVLAIYDKLIPNVKSSLVSSKTVNSGEEIRQEFYLLPVKTGSIIIITVILSNIGFSILFKKRIGLFASFLELIFLFIGFSGLFCNVNREELKKTSFILKYIYKDYKA